MSKFKVGDRVEQLDGKPFSSGYSVHRVHSIEGDKIWFVESRTWLSSKCLQLAFGHPEDTSKYHKHHDLIIQWAKGAEIEYVDYNGVWENAKTPSWSTCMEYRIKPKPPKPPKTDKERIAELEARVKELEQGE
jgi:hypothetical protein